MSTNRTKIAAFVVTALAVGALSWSTAEGQQAYGGGGGLPGVPIQVPFFYQQRPLWTPPGLSDYLAHQNDFLFPRNSVSGLVQPPMWAPSGLSDYLAGRNDFAMPIAPESQLVQTPLWQPPGVNAFIQRQAASTMQGFRLANPALLPGSSPRWVFPPNGGF